MKKGYWLLSAVAVAAPAAAQVSPVAGGVEVRNAVATMQVVALTPETLRIRVARDGRFAEDASWAVDSETRRLRAAVKPGADGFSTSALRVKVDPQTLALTVTDRAGKVIVADDAQPVAFDGRGFTLKKAMPQAEHYYGLGDKTGPLDRRGGSFVDWNTDAYGFGVGTDPIYKSIPFFVATGGAGGSYGLFLDNSWRSWFDFGHREDNVLAMGAPDGPVDYYVIAGPSTAEVVRRYGDLTGRSPLMPQWALGYQQSRYSYMTAQETRAIADRLRQDRVPTDVIWLDIDWQDRNRPFTVDTKAFPDMAGLVRDLGTQGIKLVTITDLHVARAPDQGYAPYDSGVAGDQFVHAADGKTYVAPVWPGPSVFPDFTRKSTRDWYGTLFRQQVDWGIAGVWNDMNEPAIFETPTKTMPLDTVHRIDSDGFAARTATHAEVHNIYGMQNTRATCDGLRTLRPNERAFVMTRASYAGGQKYAVTWTGDNVSSWDHLKLSVQQLLNLGLSGFAYSAADVGGFTGGPSADLLTKWFEVAAFTPVFRDHSAKNTPRAEPWVDGPEHLAIRRRYVEERYRLMPYLYGLAELNARSGDPIMRPVFYDYPAAASASCDQSMAWTLGGKLLVAGNPRPESPQAYSICLPAGGWYDYWSGRPVQGQMQGGDGPVQSASQATGAARTASLTLMETPTLDRMPVFVRAGTILPRQPLVQSTSERPQGPLELHVYPGPDCAGDLYFDDGHSMGFASGDYLRQHVSCRLSGDGRVTIDFAPREGRYAPWWTAMTVIVHDRVREGKATLSGRSQPARFDPANGTVAVTLPDQPGGSRLIVTR